MFDTSEHYQIDEAEGVVQLIMPYRKQWYQILSLIIGLLLSGCIMIPIIFYLYASGMAIALSKENPIALILPFMFLVILLIFSYIEIEWQVKGREIITITDEFVHIRHQIQGFGVTNKLPAPIISGICISRQNDLLHSFWTRRSSAFWSYKRGHISIKSVCTFLGEVQTYRFGSILDEEESNHLVEIITNRFPGYKYELSENY